jgi:transcriptional regulator with XRE-family HTH domain
MKALKEAVSTPLTDHEINQGIVIFQYIMNTFGDGSGFSTRNGSDMAYLIRALQTMKSQRLLNRRFDLNGTDDVGGPVSFVPTLQEGAPGAAGERVKLGRTALKWSRDTLSHRSKVAALTIFKIENGHSGGRPETLAALRDALETAGVVFAPDLVSWTPPVDAAVAASCSSTGAAYPYIDAGEQAEGHADEYPDEGDGPTVEYDEAPAAPEYADEPDYADPAPIDENDPANWIMIGSDDDIPGDSDEEPI